MADLAIALDLPSTDQALRLVDRLGGAGTWYKVGPVLFVSDGPTLVRELHARGKQVFLDLKWHDIPNTVAGAVTAAAALGVSLATVHLAGGRAMLEAAASARDGALLRLVGVGVLTSMGAPDYAAVIGRPVPDAGAEQERLARMAAGSGLDGFVCAVAEAARLRQVAGPRALIVTPGIRRPGEAAGDQQRTATPAEAVRAGSDLLVVGRPITEASDPESAARLFRAELAT
jgi:orotidine-5'-phosphate decarboxylase